MFYYYRVYAVISAGNGIQTTKINAILFFDSIISKQ